ncbi:MAG: hypothetical protein JOY60_08650 [Burkholderiaceae bacterium]|nr:hypothetical protein [Burkholderiaceae bacterium]
MSSSFAAFQEKDAASASGCRAPIHRTLALLLGDLAAMNNCAVADRSAAGSALIDLIKEN